MGIIDQIKIQFKQKDLLTRLIVINVAVFFLLTIFNLFVNLFKLESVDIIRYIGVSSDIMYVTKHPWTLLSYMFAHEGILHILFNMLMLYWFGRIFLTYFNQKNLASLYVFGGLAGAILYIIAFSTIPLYVEMTGGNPFGIPMIGASASVMAVIFAAAFYNPKQEVSLLLFGRIKIIYIALFIFIMDFFSLDKNNPGGSVAHIGGALLGYVYAQQYLKGKDIAAWMTKSIDWLVDLFKFSPKPPKMKVKHKGREADYEYNNRKKQNSEEIDRILDKIKSSGYTSLNDSEKKRLFDASKK